MPMSASEETEFANNCVAAGALLMALHRAQDVVPALTAVVSSPDAEANQIDVEFDFLNSPYRITVARLDQPKQSG